MHLLSLGRKKPPRSDGKRPEDEPSGASPTTGDTSDGIAAPSSAPAASSTRDESPAKKEPSPASEVVIRAAVKDARRPSSGVKELPHTVMLLKRPYENVLDYYDMGKELGRGQYGVIRSCTDKATGTPYACKSINKGKLTGQREVEDVQREIKVMEMLKGHPAVIELRAAYEDQKVC